MSRNHSRNWTQKQRETWIRGELIREGAIESIDFTSAAGRPANRKINMDVMHNSKPLERFIAAELARRADRYNPELIIPVPTGSNKIGELVARKLGIEVAFMRWLDKTPGQKSVDFRHTEDEKAVQDVSSVLVLEDVYTTGESSHAVASHPLIAEKLLGVLSIWSRLDPNNRLEVDYPTPTIIDYPVPLLVREPTSNG